MTPRPARDLSIVGASATGKSALAERLAIRLGRVELVSVDAMAVYRQLDIGTAKPAPRPGLHLHLVDLADPNEEFSVARFQAACEKAVAEARGRGSLVVFVGGTGLYHRAAVDKLELPGRFPRAARRLEREADMPGGVESLYRRLAELDPVAATRMEPSNRRRVVRALEVTLGSGRPFSSFGPGLSEYPPSAPLLVGLSMPRAELDERLAARLARQMADGFLEEVRRLSTAGGLSRTAAQAIGYKELASHLRGELTLTEALELALRRLKSFARRQEAWFRRDPRVTWVDARSADLEDEVLYLWATSSETQPCETPIR